MGDMGVDVEVFALAADQAGIWVPDDSPPWQALRLPSDTTVHGEVEAILRGHGIGDEDVDFSGRKVQVRQIHPPAAALHSTSWRQRPTTVMMTYMAVCLPGEGEMVLDMWPDAVPVAELLADLWGKPYVHDAAAPPQPRPADVLMHALRELWWGLEHLHFLANTDTKLAGVLDRWWRIHLLEFAPALANMYRHPIPGEDIPAERVEPRVEPRAA
jgi:hypothetical protein